MVTPSTTLPVRALVFICTVTFSASGRFMTADSLAQADRSAAATNVSILFLILIFISYSAGFTISHSPIKILMSRLAPMRTSTGCSYIRSKSLCDW